MNAISLTWIDYILFCLVFGASCLVGIYFGCFGSRQETKSDYLLGGRKMNVIPITVSLIASTLSSSSLLGIPTEMYMYGTQYWMMCLSVLIAGLIGNFIFLPVYHSLNITTLYEYMELRFNVHVRRMISIVYLLDCLTIMPCVVYAPALALNQMSGLDVHLIAITLSVICLFYTALGGLRGVVWTSNLQFCVTLFTLCFVIVMGSISVGGWSEIWQNNYISGRLDFNFDPNPTLRATIWSVVIGNAAIWTNYTATNPAAVQRYLALPSLSDARKTLMAYTAGTIIAKSLCCIAGLIMFTKYYNCDPLSAGYIKKPDQIFPYYVLDIAANIPGISGLFIAAMFSTALSALSSLINTLSGAIYTDLVEEYMPKKTTERVASNTIRCISVLLGVITIGFIFVIEKLGTILQLLVSFGGITAGPQLGVGILGVLFPISNSKGALCGATVTLLVMSFLATERYLNDVDSCVEYLPKPFYTHGCNSSTVLTNLAETPKISSEGPLWLYKITFYYYGFIGTFLTVTIGVLVSWITRGGTNLTSSKFLSPLVHRFIKKDAKIGKIEGEEKNAAEPFLVKCENGKIVSSTSGT